MSTTKELFLSNLAFSATADEIRDLFSRYGFVLLRVTFKVDRETGRRRGFAFATL